MKLILGDSLQKLKDLPTSTVDACVCDPPYALTSHKGAKGGFMGKQWDAEVPSVELWQEVLRVLKPGAHVLAFGGTRTYHHMAMNVELAGFEVRDMLSWLYGSGFPKSLDVSKAIDKAAGAEREVIGESPWNSRKPNGSAGVNSVGLSGTPGAPALTAPATDDAKRWQGYGTALKPANEPIVLARKPLEKGLTVAENVLKWGTGALAIDACRIATDDKLSFGSREIGDGVKYGTMPKERQTPGVQNSAGRWPANVPLDEAAAQALDAQSGVSKSTQRKRPSDTVSTPTVNIGGGIKHAGNEYADSGGASRFFFVAKHTEFDTLGVCPVESADAAQSNGADSSAQGPAPESTQQDSAAKSQNENTSAPIVGRSSKSTPETKRAKRSSVHASATLSTGLASQDQNAKSAENLAASIVTDIAQRLAVMPPDQIRAFAQCQASMRDYKSFIQTQSPASLAANPASIDITEIIQSLLKLSGSARPATGESIKSENPENGSALSRFVYCAKSSKRERNSGLEGMPETQKKRFASGGRTQVNGEWVETNSEPIPAANNHPTVKPIKLMEYLVQLVCPPGAIVLDPFMGSGTTGCAAVKLGRQFIGIEREAEYLEIARRRIEHWRAQSDEPAVPDDGQLPLPEVPA